MREMQDKNVDLQLPVTSMSMANTVSCREKHKSSGVNAFVSNHTGRRSSMWLKIPENDTSIPFITYGSGASFLPLNQKSYLTIMLQNS